MNLLRKLDSISREIEKNMISEQQLKTNVDNKRRDVADLRLLVTTHLLIIKNNTQITELKYLLMIEKRIRQKQQEIFYSLLKIGQNNVEGLLNCIHKKTITRQRMPKVKDNLLFKTTRDLQNTRRVDVLKEEVRKDLDKITMKIIKDLQDVNNKKQVEELKQEKGEEKHLKEEYEKKSSEGDKNVLAEEKDKLAEDKNVLAEEKEKLIKENKALAEEKDKLAEDKNALAAEKDNLIKENIALADEKDKLAEDKNVLAEEKEKLIKEKNIMAEEKDNLIKEKNALAEEKNAVAEERDRLIEENKEIHAQNTALQEEIKKVHDVNRPELSRNELSVNELNKHEYKQVQDTNDQDKKELNLNKKQVSVSNDKSKSKHKNKNRDTPVLLHHKKNNSDAEDESLTESFIFVLSKGSIETDKRFVELIKQTLKDIERYSDPVIVRMGIQFILAKRYVDDIIYLKEHASRKKFLIM